MPLTLVIMTAVVPDAETREKHLRLLMEPENPVMIARSIYPGIGISETPDYASAIHESYITECTGTVEGDAAHGTVFYEVPEVLAGNVDYVARRIQGAWRIVEFRLPHWGVRTVLGEDGTWRREAIN